MGQVKTEQLANGNIGLEITYGGKETPFGGVDLSAPPAYIDPRGFVACDGAIVANNKLCALSFQLLTTPTLWLGTSGIQLLGFGTFYSSTHGQLNYALGYIATPFGGSPSGVTYTFYLTSWIPGTLTTYNDTLNLDLYDSFTPAVTASLTLPCIASSSQAPSAGSGATGTITSVNPSIGTITGITMTGGTGYGVGDAVQVIPTGYTPSDYAWVIVASVGGGGAIATITLAPNTGAGYTTGAVTAGVVEAPSTTKLVINSNAYTANAYVQSMTPAGIVAQLITNINAVDPNVNASASIDGNSIILTAKTPGAAGNTITVQDSSTSNVVGQPPPFYFPAAIVENLLGGTNAVSAPAPRTFTYTSSTSVGGTVYFANLGPIIIKYSGPGSLEISSMYQGISFLSKFAGSLVGAGVIPALGFETQNQDMIFAWSAAGELDIWSPVDGSGNVTGAGFEQLDDIGEYLSGIIVSNGTAYIIRKEGISYATPTGNSLLPFSVNHIGLGAQGEGAQVSSLIIQYDSIGSYVGCSDIWQISGSISSIGAKVRQAVFAALQNETIPANQLSSATGSVLVAGDEYPVIVFVIGFTLYIFNTSNGTWSTLTLNNNVNSAATLMAGVLASNNTKLSGGQYNQSQITLMVQNSLAGPLFYTLGPNLAKSTDITNIFDVVFPQEEVTFGRDVTIDALYIALQANVSANLTLNIFLNGVLFASEVLPSATFNSLSKNPTELQIFPTNGVAVTTGHSPQLMLEFVNTNIAAQIQFTKIAMFGSVDPTQRPV